MSKVASNPSEKKQSVLAELETTENMIRSSDETNYYQQLGSLIEDLKRNGWL